MLPTPSTSHVDYSRVYEPAEDSFLLLDTLASESENTFLRQKFPANSSPTPLVLEVGTGSGVVLAFVAAHVKQIFSRTDVLVAGTDLNAFACAASCETIDSSQRSAASTEGHGTFLGTLHTDLTNGWLPGSVDVLIFNPPYVPSEVLPSSRPDSNLEDAFTRDTRLLSLSTDGGHEGMEVTERILADLDLTLSTRGVAYILLCAQNKPDAVMARVRSCTYALDKAAEGEWHVEKVSFSGNKAGWERLCVIRIWR